VRFFISFLSMKKYIPLLVVTSLLLSACSIDWGDKDNLFQKKQECYSHKEEFKESSNDTLIEIFYSEEVNSCIVRYFRNETQFHFLQDLFSNKIIASAEDPLSCITTFKGIKEMEDKCYPEKREFEILFQKLKWE